jgi:transcriptional regulator with XRE-family HTH domain
MPFTDKQKPSTRPVISHRVRLYRGLYARVAARLGLSRQFVWQVANGKRRSKRIERAIAREIAAIEQVSGVSAGVGQSHESEILKRKAS